MTALAKTGTTPNNPGTNTTDTGSDPATEYGYKNNTGVVEANTLEPGDLINYYYKDSNEQIKKFLCVVMYNDENHVLQAISLFSVRNITLGYGETNGVLYEDPKVVQAFSDKNNDGEDDAPIGYTVSLFEKARWSYNHAIGTLNSYAQEYLGLMAENARCLGAPENSIVTEENESNNMFTANPDYTYFTSYNGIFKSSDNNVIGNYITDENISEDLKVLYTLKIASPPNPNEPNCWLASRWVNSYNSVTYFGLKRLEGSSIFNGNNGLHGVSSSKTFEHGDEYGFRPIFTLKSNISIEKIEEHPDYDNSEDFYEFYLRSGLINL